ncbi:MAG: histidine kinase [bacterium]
MNARNTLIIFCIFTLLGLLSSIHMNILDHLTGGHMLHTQSLFIIFAHWYFWALLTPLIYWIVKRFPVRSNHLIRDLAFNILISVLVSVVKQLLDEMAIRFVIESFPPFPGPFGFPADAGFAASFFFALLSPRGFTVLLIYWVIVAVIYALQYGKKLKESELASSRMETLLARSQLQAIQMQIQPHFLFNTLNSISSLLRENVEAADEVITKLSDMLRYSLSKSDMQEVRLVEEIEFLKCYLEIEQVRFQNRLEVVFDINPQVSNARVPNMLLQPLVENSIRHGVSKQSTPVVISIQVHPVRDSLELVVQDTGPGIALKDQRPIREGIGLTSTRKRLQQLYGSNYEIEFITPKKKGSMIRITIPLLFKQMEASVWN